MKTQDTSQYGLADWLEGQRASDHCYTIIRVQSLMIYYQSVAGYWTRSMEEIACYCDREEAYRMARRAGGLLLIYRRGVTTLAL